MQVHSKKARWPIVVGVVAAVCGAWYTVDVGVLQPELEAQRELAIRQSLLELEPDGPIMRELANSFPDTFEAVVRATTAKLTKETGAPDARRVLRDFYAAHKLNFRAASVDALTATADQYAKFTAMLRAEDQPACANFLLGTQDLSANRMAKWSAELRAELATLRVLELKSIRSGLEAGVRREEPTDYNYMTQRYALSTSLLPQSAIDAIDAGTLTDLPEGERCEATVGYLRAIADLPDGDSAYWTAIVRGQ